MEWKSVGFGFIATIIVLASLGAVYGDFVNNGDGTYTFGYTLTTTQAVELRDCLCLRGGYEATIFDADTLQEIPNPETCADFAWGQGRKYFTQEIQACRYEAAQASIDTGDDPVVS